MDDDIPYSVSLNFYKLYSDVFNKTHNYIVNNLHTNHEIKEMYSSYDLGYGKILISGLGFGILPLWLANKPGVDTIHIVEISQDVVDMFLEKNLIGIFNSGTMLHMNT